VVVCYKGAVEFELINSIQFNINDNDNDNDNDNSIVAALPCPRSFAIGKERKGNANELKSNVR